KLPFLVNYFAPHHGHNECDGHFAAGKRALRNKIGTGVIKNPSQIIDAFSSVKDTAPGTNLGEILENRQHTIPFPKLIRKWFQFYFFKKGEIWCRETWESENWVKQEIVIAHTSKEVQQEA